MWLGEKRGPGGPARTRGSALLPEAPFSGTGKVDGHWVGNLPRVLRDARGPINNRPQVTNLPYKIVAARVTESSRRLFEGLRGHIRFPKRQTVQIS
jgi:hypothetical protein